MKMWIVLSGDIYDQSDRSLKAQIQFQAAMEKLAKNRIHAYIIHGNHDPEDGRKAVLSWPETVHFFDSNQVQMKPAYHRSGHMLAHVYGISYPTAAVTENLAVKFEVQDEQMYSIGLLHCNVDGDPSHEYYAPCSKYDLIGSGIKYWALGHVHSRKIIHSDPYIVYPGNTQGRSVREIGTKGCYVVDVSEQGETKLTFHRTDAVSWFHETISIDDMKSEQELTDALDELMEQIQISADGLPAIVRVTIEGRGELHMLLQRESEIQELVDSICQQQTKLAEMNESIPFVWLDSIKVKTGIKVNKEQVLTQDSFLGDLLRISQRLSENEEQFNTFSQNALDALASHPAAWKYMKEIPKEQTKEWLKSAEELAIHLLYVDGSGKDEN